MVRVCIPGFWTDQECSCSGIDCMKLKARSCASLSEAGKPAFLKIEVVVWPHDPSLSRSLKDRESHKRELQPSGFANTLFPCSTPNKSGGGRGQGIPRRACTHDKYHILEDLTCCLFVGVFAAQSRTESNTWRGHIHLWAWPCLQISNIVLGNFFMVVNVFL